MAADRCDDGWGGTTSGPARQAGPSARTGLFRRRATRTACVRWCNGPQRLTRLIRIAVAERSPSRYREQRCSSSTSSTIWHSKDRRPSSPRRSRWRRRLATLKRRASAAGVPTIYINDNFGQWRSDFRRTVAHCTSRSSPGRRVSRRLRPSSRDYFVLKPKHSGFFDTTLDTLLATLRIRRVVLTGIAGNICVLFTANDAYMRDLKSSRRPIALCRTPQPTTPTLCTRFRRCSRETSRSCSD